MATELVPGFFVSTSSTNERTLDDDAYDDDDLGIGTSSGAGYRNRGAQPLTLESLLTNTIRWVGAKDSSSQELPYEPINQIPVPSPTALSTDGVTVNGSSPSSPSLAKAPPSTANGTPPDAPSSSSVRGAPPFFPLIDTSVAWAKKSKVGRGLHNLGNTCFLNSALQVLLHTAPLVRYLDSQREHGPPGCAIVKGPKGFCMTCTMKDLVLKSFDERSTDAYVPSYINNNLKKIAQHLRKGRQEDAHEFLRFVIDGMQLSALHGKGAKLDQRLKESTFVHQIFGGRLRSRVECMSCGHFSDTFDSILDLSLDVLRFESIRDALKDFVRVDQLKGANKYKCEKCKKHVVAEKSFTIDQAPLVLTIHLKRFRPDGRKNNDPIKFTEKLELGSYMSDPSINPTYRLYGVVHHFGGGPHSGHYTAEVRGPNGEWYNMDDSNVSRTAFPSTGTKRSSSAYILFYCRDRGDQLQAAIHGGTRHQAHPISQTSRLSNANGHANVRDHPNGFVMNGDTNSALMNGHGNGKRPRETDGGPDTKKPFIGPTLPPSFQPAGAADQQQPPRVSVPVKQPPVLIRPAPAAPGNFYGGQGGGTQPTRPNSPMFRGSKAKQRVAISTRGDLSKAMGKAGAMKPKSQQGKPALLT